MCLGFFSCNVSGVKCQMQKIDPFFKLSTRKQILNILNPQTKKTKEKKR